MAFISSLFIPESIRVWPLFALITLISRRRVLLLPNQQKEPVRMIMSIQKELECNRLNPIVLLNYSIYHTKNSQVVAFVIE